MRDTSNSSDVIDSREVDDRIEDIEALPEESLDDDDKAELALLVKLKDDVSSGEWKYGLTLIRDSYFEDYARQTADEIGAIDAKAGWPCNCIDWAQAAEQLQQDYTTVEYDGITYWYRA
jgi:hypothetical protein